MSDVCKMCSGTGSQPNTDEAYARVIEAACKSEELWGNIIAEDGLKWADVLAIAREWRRFAPASTGGSDAPR